MENKIFSIEEYKEVDDSIIEIIASDESLDRDNDIILAEGWSVNNWLKSGSLIYGHNPANLPVGTAHAAEIRDGKLILQSKLAKKGTSDWHDTIRSLVSQKILKGVSVGFKATDYDMNEYGGRTFKQQELLEISLTPVPANPNAMVKVKSLLGDKFEEQKSALYSYRGNASTYNQEKESEEQEAQDAEALKEETKFLEIVDQLKKIL